MLLIGCKVYLKRCWLKFKHRQAEDRICDCGESVNYFVNNGRLEDQ